MFTVSENYLSGIYKNQDDFDRSLELLSSPEAPTILSPVSAEALNKRTYSPEDKRLMDIWIEVFAKATDISANVKPLFILRCMQLLQYGFLKGWRSPKQWTLIQKIYQNFKFAVIKNQIVFFTEGRYQGFSTFYHCMRFEFANDFPYTHSTFKNLLLMHFDECLKNLSKYSPEVLLTSNEKLQKSKLNSTLEPTIQQFPKINQTDLQPIFEKYLLRPDMSKQLPHNFLKLLSRRINYYISSLKKNKPGNIPFKIELQHASAKGVSLYNCMTHISGSHHKVDLYITPAGPCLDEGAESKVYRSQKFTLFINAAGSVEVSHTRMVKIIPNHEIDSELVNCALKVDNFHTIIRQKPTKINLIPRKFLCAASPFTYFQMYEEWYNSNLSTVFDTMKIPEDFFPGAKLKPISIREYFPLLIAGAKILAKIHNIGLAHLDIKPNNLLVRLQEDGRLQIMPTDFTRCSPFKMDIPSDNWNSYYYWDTTRKQKGTALPYTDWYGMIITTADALIPKFGKIAREGVLGLWRMEQHKADTYDIFVALYTEVLAEVELPSNKSMASLCQALENHLRRVPVSEIVRICLYEIAYKAKAIDMVFDLFVEMLTCEKKIVEDFPGHEIRACMILSNGSLQDKIKFLNEISMGPALMETLIVRLEKIYATLEAYYEELVAL